MAQYSSVKSGSLVNVTNGSNVVTGTGSDWLGKISVGDGFTVAGTSIVYDVASVDSDTQLTLTINYSGPSATGKHYTIHRDFTSPDNIPELSNGDIETGTIMKRLARVVQGRLNALSGLTYTGLWTSGTVYPVGSIVIYDDGTTTAAYVANVEHTAATVNQPPDATWDVLFTDINTVAFTSLSWIGDWTASTEYFEQNVVRYNDNIYVAKANFVSGTTFDATNFDILIDIQSLYQIRTDAQAARDKAQLWANEVEDVIVEGTEYSSKHYSIKASGSAAAASTSESNALTYSNNASTSADLSENWATLLNATVDGTEYSSKHYSQEASVSASNASTSASNALTSENNAATSASNALTSENKAEDWAENPVDIEVEVGKFSALHHSSKASDSAAAASTSENNAATSASNALTSENNAATSASNALTSENNAATSESNALTSANTSEDWATLLNATVDGFEYSSKHYSQEASASASNALTSENNALTSENNAATSESNSLTSANNAATSESNALTSADLSEDWATLLNATVDGVEYSSKHYSQEASASASNASTSEQNALASENKAQQWADAPLGTEVEPSKYSARHWAEQLGAIPETAYNWQGDWVAGTYNAGDAVFHVPTSSSYITLITTTTEPNLAGTSDWQLLARAAQFEDAAFLSLDDTPSAYTGAANQFVQVNGTEDGLVFTNADNYGGWILTVDGVSRGNIDSSESVDFIGGNNTTLSYNATGNVITIDSLDTTYSAGTGITLTGTTFSLTGESYTTTEKNKLADIESGATADQTASEILTAVKTVDGSGSGLDADLLDGNHASAFALDSSISTVGKTGSYNDLLNKPDLSVLDDVLSYSSQAEFPATGETGKVYVAEDTGYIYRWNGTAYVQLTDQTAIWGEITGTLSNQTDLQNALNAKLDSASAYTSSDFDTDFGAKSTTDLSEGTNLYYTDAKARGAISVSGDLSYDISTGVVSFSETYSNASEIKTAYESNVDTNAYTDAEKTKLSNIESGATANSSDAFLLDRTNHTGTQTISTVTNLQTSLDAKLEDAPIDGSQYARKDGAWSVVESASGGKELICVSAAHTATDNQHILADTSAGVFTVTLPATPTNLTSVLISDYAGTFAFNNLTVARNGSTIQDEAVDAVLSNSYREVYFIYYNSTWNVFVQPNYRWLTPNQFVLSGPDTANEGDEISVFIDPFDTGATYTVKVSRGSFTRTGDQITWTIPTVANDETHFIKVEESTVGGTVVVVKEVNVFNIPTLADDSISVTDFSVNYSNTGWEI